MSRFSSPGLEQLLRRNKIRPSGIKEIDIEKARPLMKKQYAGNGDEFKCLLSIPANYVENNKDVK